MQVFSTRSVPAAFAGYLISLFLPLAAHAQSTAGRGIHGRVAHAGSDVGISPATVDVTSIATGTAVGHATTSADGAFRVPVPRAGQYRVVVRALGFAPKTLPV